MPGHRHSTGQNSLVHKHLRDIVNDRQLPEAVAVRRVISHRDCKDAGAKYEPGRLSDDGMADSASNGVPATGGVPSAP